MSKGRMGRKETHTKSREENYLKHTRKAEK